jgi:hypothetical protein
MVEEKDDMPEATLETDVLLDAVEKVDTPVLDCMTADELTALALTLEAVLL